MRLIDADKLREDWLTNGENEHIYDTNAFLDSIDEQPTVDAEEVVRCKDCQLYTPVEGGKPLRALHSIAVAQDDFCSCEERRKEK